MSADTLSITRNGLRIYRNINTVEVPRVDLPTLLFDTEHSLAADDSPLHLSASNPNIYLTKTTLRAPANALPTSCDTASRLAHKAPAGGVFSAASPSSIPEELARQIEQGKKWEFRALEGGKRVDPENGQRLMWRRITDEEELKSLHRSRRTCPLTISDSRPSTHSTHRRRLWVPHLAHVQQWRRILDADFQQAANAKLGKGQTKISQTWGLSETTGAVAAMPRGSSDITGSISPVLPSMEMRIVDDNYCDVDEGQPGEIIVRGPFVTNGYQGYGKFYIVDRKKELIKYKGLQIAPAELENHLITHNGILEAAVVGVPIEGGSEVPRAYGVLRKTEALSEDDVKAFVKGALAEYKQLRNKAKKEAERALGRNSK
ncbi:acetyl-CoA synthetase-like protein [Massarina eburnea CBS 473.64]|uniref:Acetyl-CoA synthetase-like protein n=1 Tax=Massarina eburnea CBS 473.64 TaxID=1395130 RepID=A0A6A6SCD1_9PLEO|nr:acetyl-CoA synthetase-like protein [Massarina eburnea CBS 473.64]